MTEAEQLSQMGAEQENPGINIKQIVFRYLRRWPMFVVAVGLFVGLAVLYLRYNDKMYDTKAKVLFHDQEENVMEGLSLFASLGFMDQGSKLGNEVALMKTPGVLRGVARQLNLRQTCYLVGRRTGIRKTELFNTAPVEVKAVRPDSIFETKG
ncbi:MAG: hypothetical protein NWR49_09205, partial [Crocinitomicaceae bacterium]|nr:hypothetical protein [Crocinitomicaceae bacterium]